MTFFNKIIDSHFIQNYMNSDKKLNNFSETNDLYTLTYNCNTFFTLHSTSHRLIGYSDNIQKIHDILGHFEYIKMESSILKSIMDDVIKIAVDMSFYHSDMYSLFHYNRFTDYLSIKSIIKPNLILQAYYDSMGFTINHNNHSAKRNKKRSEIKISRDLLVNDEGQLVDYYIFSMPFGGSKKIIIGVTTLNNTHCYTLLTEHDDQPVLFYNYEDIKTAIYNKFLNNYRLKIKKYLNIDNAEINKNYGQLIDMVKC